MIRRTFAGVAAAIAVALVTGLLAAGCSCGGPSPGEGLEGVDWTLQGSSASSVDFLALGVTARFEDEAVKGSSGVNSYTGKYAVAADGSLTISELETTKMTGTPEAMQAEEMFLTMLRAVRSFAVTGDTLKLLDKDGNALLSFGKSVAAPDAGAPAIEQTSVVASAAPGVPQISDTSVAYARSIGGTSHKGELLYLVVGASHPTEAAASAELDGALPLLGDMQSYFIVQRSDNFAGLTPGLWVIVEAYRNSPSESNLQFARRAFEDAYVKRAMVRTGDPIPVYEDLVD